MEGFLELYNEACWDDETLNHLFWKGISLVLLWEDHCPLTEFADYTLQSSLTIVVEHSNNISNSTVHVPLIEVISLPSPDRTQHPRPDLNA